MWCDPYCTSHGLVHPFDYLIPPPGYDDLVFRRIPAYFEECIHRSSGIVFDLQDGNPSLDETGDVCHWHGQSLLGYAQFQKRVYGQVDFIVAPASVDSMPPFSDSLAGVRRLKVEVLRQQGHSWVGTPYSNRLVFDFSYPIPFGDTEEYYSLFFDPPVQVPDFHWHQNTSYIASNSGCYSGAFDTSYDNIWTSTDPNQIHNWSTGEYNRGCWDTRMRNPGSYRSGYPDQAFIPENAAFPDGRYAVKVTATTHGGVTGSMILPKLDVKDPSSPIVGVLVDNFYPHVTSVTVTNNSHLIYNCAYSAPAFAKPNVTERSVTSTYHEREGSHFLEVSVSFSEPVIVDDIWIDGVAGPYINWSSKLISSDPDQDDGRSNFTFVTETKAPEEYLGRLVLNISAHDLSLHQLDSNPVTIPFPHKGGSTDNDECYEPGTATFEWNIARFPCDNGGIYPGELIYGYQINSFVPHRFYTCNMTEMFNDFQAHLNVGIPFSTRGPGTDNYQYSGYCAEYGGYWLFPYANGLWPKPDYYDCVHLCYPSVNAKCNWDYIRFDLPFTYGPHSYCDETDLSTRSIPSQIDLSGRNGGQIVSDDGIYDENSTSSYSCATGAKATYSDGSYCFIAWDDWDAATASFVGHLTCVSAISRQMRHINGYPGSVSLSGGSAAPLGDSVGVDVHNGPHYVYSPYSPEFFPEENPDSDYSCSPQVDFVDNLSSIPIRHRNLIISCNNPIRSGDNLNIAFEAVPEAAVSAIMLYDLTGRCVASFEEQIYPGQNAVSIPVGDLPTALYSIHVKVGSTQFKKNVLIL